VTGFLALALSAGVLSTCSDTTGLTPLATKLFWGSGASAAFVEDSVPLVVFYADSLDHPIGTPRPQVTWRSSDPSIFRILNDTLGTALDTGLVTLTARTRREPELSLNVSLLVLPRPTGSMVWVRTVAAGEQPRLVWQDFPEHEVHVVPEFTYPGSGHGRGRLTADRRRIVTYAPRPVSPIANEALYIIDLPGGAARILLDTMAGHQITPVWLPGDTLIAFLANRSGAWEVWTVRPDGTDARRRTSLRQPRPPVFGLTPDETLVLPLIEPEGATDFYEVTLGGDTVRRITFTPDIEEGDVAVSPDGRTIAYTVLGPGSQVWLMDRDGADPRRLVPPHGVVVPGIPLREPFPVVAGTLDPFWTPDGEFVLVVWTADPSLLNGGYALLGEIYAVRLSDRRAVRLTRWPSVDAQPSMR
jgi:hypothetical protein